MDSGYSRTIQSSFLPWWGGSRTPPHTHTAQYGAHGPFAHQETEYSHPEYSYPSSHMQPLRFSGESEAPKGLKQSATTVQNFLFAAGLFSYSCIHFPPHSFSNFYCCARCWEHSSGSKRSQPCGAHCHWQSQTIKERNE